MSCTMDHQPLQLESGVCKNPVKKEESWKTVLLLAYQSLGVVYGQLSISPLYVYGSTFAEDIEISKTNEEIFGVLSFVFWTVTLVPLLKYVFIVLRADDNGEGGTFALYSLLCRHAKIGFMPNFQVADEELSAYRKDQNYPSNGNKGLWLKSILEKSRVLQKMLLVLSLIGACMVIGDGVLTPAISVVSALSGLELNVSPSIERDIQLFITCIILACLFTLQHYGTHRVGFLFAPIILTWLLCIAAVGVFNILFINPLVYKALCPLYMFRFLKKSRARGWLSLGGILLCITGSEAMFAGLGHFSQLSIKIAFTFLVYPSLTLAYMGQAAYLSKNHDSVISYSVNYHKSVPGPLRWPVLLISVLAAVVGSQAIITGTFSIIKQCLALGCFPLVKVVHTSSKRHGQIYIPEINWILMLLCLAVTIGFQDVGRLGNASGLAVITVMLVTTCLMSLVIVLCWHQNIFLAICFILFFGSFETLYFSASLFKIREGAWFPVVLSFVFTVVMYIWHYGSLKKYGFDVQNKISIDWILSLGPSLGLVRVPGIGVVHTELVSGIPLIFSHFVTNLPAFHQVLVFLCIKSVPVPYVQPEERYLVGRIGPREYRIYRCIARYGYHDIREDGVEFERDLICSIAEFIRSENPKPKEKELEKMTVVGTYSNKNEGVQLWEEDDKGPAGPKTSLKLTAIGPPDGPRKRVKFLLPQSPQIDEGVYEELKELSEARESGMAFILGHSCLRAQQQSCLVKRLAINIGYNFLRRNSRSLSSVSSTPHISTLEVGMVHIV